jgi:predicted nucleic acid-binding protein
VIVLDSSFLVAFHNTRDVHHEAARSVMERLVRGEWGRALLPEYVFLEVVTVLAARRSLGTAVSAGEALLRAQEVDFVPCSEHFLDAWEVFRAQDPPTLSLADAAIVAIARIAGADRVATFDADFRRRKGLRVVP